MAVETSSATLRQRAGRPAPDDRLPSWQKVLAVVAHPDDESFGLGAVIAEFADTGAKVTVLCFSRGEASTLGAGDDLAALRAGELRLAAERLGVHQVRGLDLPDGGLPERLADLVDLVAAELDVFAADGVLVFDPDGGVTGHPDHEAASRAAVVAAGDRGLSVLGWGVPRSVAWRLNAELGASFHPLESSDVVISVDRARQRTAIAAHESQAVPSSVLWRRLELCGDQEHLRRLC